MDKIQEAIDLNSEVMKLVMKKVEEFVEDMRDLGQTNFIMGSGDYEVKFEAKKKDLN